jgi:hypothetical protein
LRQIEVGADIGCTGAIQLVAGEALHNEESSKRQKKTRTNKFY